MDILLDVGIIISDLILSIFAGDDCQKIAKWMKKRS